MSLARPVGLFVFSSTVPKSLRIGSAKCLCRNGQKLPDSAFPNHKVLECGSQFLDSRPSGVSSLPKGWFRGCYQLNARPICTFGSRVQGKERPRGNAALRLSNGFHDSETTCGKCLGASATECRSCLHGFLVGVRADAALDESIETVWP